MQMEESNDLISYIRKLDRDAFDTIRSGIRVDLLSIKRYGKSMYLLETVPKSIRFAISDDYSYVENLFDELEASL